MMRCVVFMGSVFCVNCSDDDVILQCAFLLGLPVAVVRELVCQHCIVATTCFSAQSHTVHLCRLQNLLWITVNRTTNVGGPAQALVQVIKVTQKPKSPDCQRPWLPLCCIPRWIHGPSG